MSMAVPKWATIQFISIANTYKPISFQVGHVFLFEKHMCLKDRSRLVTFLGIFHSEQFVSITYLLAKLPLKTSITGSIYHGMRVKSSIQWRFLSFSKELSVLKQQDYSGISASI